jgi:hypothetical protein
MPPCSRMFAAGQSILVSAVLKQRCLPLLWVQKVASSNPANRFKLPGQGSLKVLADDMMII